MKKVAILIAALLALGVINPTPVSAADTDDEPLVPAGTYVLGGVYSEFTQKTTAADRIVVIRAIRNGDWLLKTVLVLPAADIAGTNFDGEETGVAVVAGDNRCAVRSVVHSAAQEISGVIREAHVNEGRARPPVVHAAARRRGLVIPERAIRYLWIGANVVHPSAVVGGVVLEDAAGYLW